MEMANGDQYVGEWKADQMHGKGKYISSEGEYDGSWVEGLRQGQGRIKMNAGTTYEGGFFRHQYHGQGLLKLQNGTYYDGQFVRGQIHGPGFRTFADGSIYEGSFVQGDCHGTGRWFSNSNGGWLFDGVFNHGRPVDGEMILSDGEVWHHVYAASSIDSLGFNGKHLEPGLRRHIGKYGQGWDGHRDFSGNMIWKWTDGREFRGTFEVGAPVRGRLLDSDKAWYNVQYNNGIRISDDRLIPHFKKLAPEEVEKDLLFSTNLEQIHKRLASEEEAYEAMLVAIEQELEARVLTETKLWVPPPPTPPLELDYSGFELISSAAVSVSIRLGIEFKTTGTATSVQRAEWMATLIMDLANATGTHERLFRITKMTAGSVILNVEILSDPKGQFQERSPAEIAVFLLEQTAKPLSRFMRGKLTKKLLSIDLPAHVYEVIQLEKEARRPKTIVKVVVKEDPPPPPPKWSPILEHRTWQPDVLGVGFHVGRIDLRAAAQFKSQLEAVHTYNVDQFAKRPKPPPRVHTPEPEYLSGIALVEQIREFVAFLYAGATLKNNIPEDEKYTTLPNTAAATGPNTSHSSTCSTARLAPGSKGVVRERRDQRRAAKGILKLLGGNADGSLDSEGGWHQPPLYNKKHAQATSTAELLWAHGGIKALVYVLRGAYPDNEFTDDISMARNEKERDNIVRTSVVKGDVDIRELAAECVLRACSLNPANRMRLRMKIGPNRPEGDGTLALVELLSRGSDGSRERAAAALAIICKSDLQSKEDVSIEGGVEALLALFAEHCPASLKLKEMSRLHYTAEGRKFRASSAANQQMRVTLMDEAQQEMDLLDGLQLILRNRVVKLKEAGIEALYTITTDCHIACESMLVDGGLEVMKHTIVERQADATSREGIIEIESATGIIENVCRCFFQPGVLKEAADAAPSDAAPSAGGGTAAARGAPNATISILQLQSLHGEIEKLNLVGILCKLLQPDVAVHIQARAAGALWAIVEGNHESYTAQILALHGMPLIMTILKYGASGDQDELEARELTVGLLSSMMKGNELCCNASKACGAVARLMHLMNLGDDGLGAFSTQELAASALAEALENSEDCRSEARRLGIRSMITTLLDSPLLNSPDNLERQQARSSRTWAQKLLNLVNRPPHRGEKGTAKIDELWGVRPCVKIQCNYRMHSSRTRLQLLRAMPATLRQSLLRIENAIPNLETFYKYCAFETEDGYGGHLGSRAMSMDVYEFIEILKYLEILQVDPQDKHKVSKAQAVAAFKSINADAQQYVNGRKLPPPQELDYERYQKSLKRCLKMLKSEAEAVGDVEEEEDRTESPMARGGVSVFTPFKRRCYYILSMCTLMLSSCVILALCPLCDLPGLKQKSENIFVHIFTCVCVYVYVHICVCVHIYIYTYIYIHIYMYMYYMYIHIFVYTDI